MAKEYLVLTLNSLYRVLVVEGFVVRSEQVYNENPALQGNSLVGTDMAEMMRDLKWLHWVVEEQRYESDYTTDVFSSERYG